jgi:hypothetical protein
VQYHVYQISYSQAGTTGMSALNENSSQRMFCAQIDEELMGAAGAFSLDQASEIALKRTFSQLWCRRS